MNSEIKINVSLDENKIPEKISWNATDGGINNQEASAILISVWDTKEKNSLRLDLWTKEMTIDDMKNFFHQTLLSMSDTYLRATSDQKMADTFKDFCDYFKENTIDKNNN